MAVTILIDKRVWLQSLPKLSGSVSIRQQFMQASGSLNDERMPGVLNHQSLLHERLLLIGLESEQPGIWSCPCRKPLLVTMRNMLEGSKCCKVLVLSSAMMKQGN